MSLSPKIEPSHQQKGISSNGASPVSPKPNSYLVNPQFIQREIQNISRRGGSSSKTSQLFWVVAALGAAYLNWKILEVKRLSPSWNKFGMVDLDERYLEHPGSNLDHQQLGFVGTAVGAAAGPFLGGSIASNPPRINFFLKNLIGFSPSVTHPTSIGIGYIIGKEKAAPLPPQLSIVWGINRKINNPFSPSLSTDSFKELCQSIEWGKIPITLQKIRLDLSGAFVGKSAARKKISNLFVTSLFTKTLWRGVDKQKALFCSKNIVIGGKNIQVPIEVNDQQSNPLSTSTESTESATAAKESALFAGQNQMQNLCAQFLLPEVLSEIALVVGEGARDEVLSFLQGQIELVKGLSLTSSFEVMNKYTSSVLISAAIEGFIKLAVANIEAERGRYDAATELEIARELTRCETIIQQGKTNRMQLDTAARVRIEEIRQGIFMSTPFFHQETAL